MEPNEKLALFQMNREEYGNNYEEHFLEQYKLYVETTDRVSDRRNTTNTFFLTANTLLVTIFGAIVTTTITSSIIWIILFALAGVVFSFAWLFIVRSYGQLNGGKFSIIKDVEKKLPLALHEAEWKVLGEGRDPKLYRP